MRSVYSAAPDDWAIRTLVRETLLLYRDAGRCILQPQMTGPSEHSLAVSYPSAGMQLVYFAAPANWADHNDYDNNNLFIIMNLFLSVKYSKSVKE